MENWGEDWICEDILYLLDKLSEFNEKWKMADMSSWDTLPMQGTSYLIVLILECAQNMEIGMNRYTAFASQIAGIASFIRVKECWVGGRCRKVTLG